MEEEGLLWPKKSHEDEKMREPDDEDDDNIFQYSDGEEEEEQQVPPWWRTYQIVSPRKLWFWTLSPQQHQLFALTL